MELNDVGKEVIVQIPDERLYHLRVVPLMIIKAPRGQMVLWNYHQHTNYEDGAKAIKAFMEEHIND